MKITVIHGSMRKGNTYKLTREYINRLSMKPDVAITEFSVAELSCECRLVCVYDWNDSVFGC